MAATNLIDLSQLPAPAVVEVLDFESYVSAYKADLVVRDPDLADVLALESEPIVKLVEACAYRELLIRNRINQAANANMLAYAVGPDLDNLVANLGVQRLSGELDPALLSRATLAPDGWSTAGPINAYKYHAKSADYSISDVAVSQPTPGQVRVAILSSAVGGVPTADVLAAVITALNDEDVRPFTDQVVVVAAATATYNVIAQLSVPAGSDSGLVISAAQAAVQTYATAQRKLNTKISLKKLTAALMQPNVDDFTLNLTADIPAQAGIAPELGVLTIVTQALGFFRSRGWTVQQSAGIVANLVRESGLNARAQNASSGAYGVTQWLGSRVRNFQAFTGHALRGSSLLDQLRFTDHELRTTHATVGRALSVAASARSAAALINDRFEINGVRRSPCRA